MQPKRWFIILVMVAGVAVLIASILRLLTPQSQPLPTSPFVQVNVDGSSTTFENVSFVGTATTMPRTAKITQVETIPVNPLEQLIADFQLTPHPDLEEFWANERFNLILIPEVNQYSFTQNENFDSPTSGINAETAQSAAQNFVTTYFADSNLVLLDENVRYLMDEHAEDVDPSKANFIYFPYSYKIDNFLLKMGPANLLPLSVTVNAQSQIVEADFFAQLYSFNVADTKPTLTIEQAIKNINAGKASINRAVNADLKMINLQTVTSAQLTRVEMEYRLDEALRLAYPYYHFYGTAVDDQDTSFEVEILTPAVAVGEQPV